jgi:alkanesulfonate monooxygenase SsuD/methylene tetrahydromethanopterin reductase-like flavin-dependent oxidoreductase (luciferase family)
MDLLPERVPPLYIGAMREKSLQLAGQIGDGTILTAISSPEYVRWARESVDRCAAESGRANRLAVFVYCKVSHDGQIARDATRAAMAQNYPWSDVQITPTGFTEEIAAFVRERGAERLASEMPDSWLDSLAAAGRPEQAAAMLMRLASAGADTIILQPLNGDAACLDEYIRDLLPIVKRQLANMPTKRN